MQTCLQSSSLLYTARTLKYMYAYVWASSTFLLHLLHCSYKCVYFVCVISHMYHHHAHIIFYSTFVLPADIFSQIVELCVSSFLVLYVFCFLFLFLGFFFSSEWLSEARVNSNVRWKTEHHGNRAIPNADTYKGEKLCANNNRM